MRKVLVSLIAILILLPAHAALADPYGTIVYKDGSMVAIYKSARHTNRSYVAKFKKNGQLSGCDRESKSAYQLRKAYMKAQARFRRGYVPRKYPCNH